MRFGGTLEHCNFWSGCVCSWTLDSQVRCAFRLFPPNSLRHEGLEGSDRRGAGRELGGAAQVASSMELACGDGWVSPEESSNFRSMFLFTRNKDATSSSWPYY